MRHEILILREREILELLDPTACIAAMGKAFASYSGGRAELPSVIHLDVPEHRGEIHIKTGHLHGNPYYAVKMVSGFPGNTELGLPANDGMVVAFHANTGAPAAFLLDNGLITDIRTAAAGALAAKHLARGEVHRVAVIGTGGQARYQTEMLARVRSFRELRVWGRNQNKAYARIEDLEQRGNLPTNCRVSVAKTIAEAVADSDVVITVTASHEPLVRAEWLKAGVTVIAVGSDAPDKRELDVDVLARGDRIVADSLPQCLRLGEIHHAVEKGAVVKEKICELGEIVAGQKPGRLSEDEIIVCDLTGVGVQDVAAASLVIERAKAAGRGERISLQD
jgi:ornithine cyclodeaminase/alanine dehydrogenase-like protein (mu-crystallin family)